MAGNTKTATSSGDALVLLAMALFGCYALFLRYFPDIPTLAFLVAFQVVGAVVLGFGMRGLDWQAVRRRLPLLFALSVCAIGNDLTYFAAFRLTSVANAAIAHQSMSLFLLILAPWLLKERTRREEWIGLSVALVGFAVLYLDGVRYSGTADIVGISLGLLSGLFMAFVIILYRTLPGDDMPVRAVNFCRYSIGTALLVPVFAFTGLDQVEAPDVLPLVAFAVLFGVIGTSLHAIGISRTRSLHASILGKTEPVFAALYAFVLLNEGLSAETLVGGALVLGSSLWLTLKHRESSS